MMERFGDGMGPFWVTQTSPALLALKEPPMRIRFSIQGTVRDGETGAGVPGLFVKAFDKDLLFDDLLGSAITGADGSFVITTESSDFREFFEVRPDLYLRVFHRDRVREIWSSKDAVRWSAGR